MRWGFESLPSYQFDAGGQGPAEAHNLSERGALPRPATNLFRLAGCWRRPDKALEHRSIRWSRTNYGLVRKGAAMPCKHRHLGALPSRSTNANANAKRFEQHASQAWPSEFESRRVHHEAGVAGRTARLSSVAIAGSSPVRFSNV